LFASVKLIVRRKLHGYPIALRRTYLLVAAALLLYCLVILPVAPTFIFYQWTIRDSWLSALFSVIVFLLLAVGLILQVTNTTRVRRFTFGPLTLIRVAPVGYQRTVGSRKLPQFWPLSLTTIAFFVKSILIGFGQKKRSSPSFWLAGRGTLPSNGSCPVPSVSIRSLQCVDVFP